MEYKILFVDDDLDILEMLCLDFPSGRIYRSCDCLLRPGSPPGLA